MGGNCKRIPWKLHSVGVIWFTNRCWLILFLLLFLAIPNGVKSMPLKLENVEEYLSRKDPATTKKIDFKDNIPTGTIPTVIGSFTVLTQLELGHGEIKGNIPSEIGELRLLKTLVLSSNSITGSVPSEIGELSGLNKLYLDNLQLKKQIPTELGNLVELVELSLDGNKITGTIPSQLGKLQSIAQLRLDRTDLTGTIPRELEELQKLVTYKFPSSVCAIKSSQFANDVTKCDISQAPVTSIPTSYIPTSLPTSPATLSPTSESGKLSKGSNTADSIDMGAVYVFAIFVGILIIITCLLVTCFRQKSENAVGADESTRGNTAVPMKAVFSLFSVTLALFDMTTDFMYSASLFSEGKTLPAFTVLIFVFLPVICNLVAILWFQHRKMRSSRHGGDRAYKRWIEQNEVLSVIITLLSSVSTELLALASVGVWKLNLPLSIVDIYQLRTLGIITSVLEDIPQMAVVVMTQESEDWSIIAIVTLASSIVSFMFTVIFRLQSCILWLNADVDPINDIDDIEEPQSKQWSKTKSNRGPDVSPDNDFNASVSKDGNVSSKSGDTSLEGNLVREPKDKDQTSLNVS